MVSPRLSLTAVAERIFPAAVFLALAVSAYASSSISGIVYDDQRNPLFSVDVELLNENYVLRGKTRTDGTGRYQFSNLADGRYYVRVLPFRFNLNDQTQEVLIETFSITGNGVSFQIKDFFLTRKSGSSDPRPRTTAVVFAQEVPLEAELLYKEGAEAFAAEDIRKGVERMTAALEKFPTYFAALHDFGVELMKRGEYTEAAKLFIRAVEVNPKSYQSFYYMGVSLHKMGKEYGKAALVALSKAEVLSPGSYQILLEMGRIERQEGQFEQAEKHLLKAKEVAERPVPEIHIELAQLYGNDLMQFGKAADELEMYLKASNEKDTKISRQIKQLREKAKRQS